MDNTVQSLTQPKYIGGHTKLVKTLSKKKCRRK